MGMKLFCEGVGVTYTLQVPTRVVEINPQKNWRIVRARVRVEYGYVSFVVFTIRPVFHWWLITRCLTRVTRRVWSRNCLHFRLLVDTKYYIMYMYLHLFCDNICYMNFQNLIHFCNFKEVELWTWVVPTFSVEIS